jgi:hypothetical protein
MIKITDSIHYKYAKYLWLHKKYVFIECCKLGIPFLGIIHDLSKFIEWNAYAKYFYGTQTDEVKDAFDYAWLNHQHVNKHHWQRWIIKMDDGGEVIKPMKDRYRREMLADWIGAGKAIKKTHPDWEVLCTKDWYLKNHNNIILHPETRRWIESQLGIPWTV